MTASNGSDDIFKRVKKVVSEVLNLNEDKIKIDSKIIDDLGAESLDIVTMLMEFEDEFGQTIPDEDAEKLSRVSDVVNYILDKQLQSGK